MTPQQKAALWREELLSRLNPSIRPRIDANPEYEELVALLAAWLEATDEHLSMAEERVVTRLSEELAPGGDWKFPVQTLAIPRELKPRRVEEDTPFQGASGIDDQWRPCGEGWTRPTELSNWYIEFDRTQGYALVCEIHTDKPGMRLLLPSSVAEPKDGQQLAFVCGDEDIISALSRASWSIQHPGERHWQAVSVTRYLDYLRLERGLGGARSSQRQLSAWLPPFYPYSRKFLRFSLSEPVITRPEEEWDFLGTGAEFIRLAAFIDETTAERLEAIAEDSVEAARNPLILNAVPLVQMQSMAEDLLQSPFQTGEGYSQPFTAVWNVFGAAVRETRTSDNGIYSIYPAARLKVKPVEFAARRQGEQSAEITCGVPSKTAAEYQARLYFGSHGQEITSPRELFRGPQSFTTPFPALGGKNASVTQYGDAGARHAWYHSFLRAPQPSVADIIEILSQIPACYDYLNLDYAASGRRSMSRMIQLDVENRPRAERSAWENYLWPSLVSDETLLEMHASFLSASQVAIMPRMRLHFEPKRKEFPSFLWREMERYVASVLSQYFMIGWYRMEGVVHDR